MATNFLNFTKMTFNEIRSQISDKLSEDPNFENFLDSSIAQTIIDVFAATTDLTNYYLERRAEEQFFDTARLKSSVILLSKILAYSVTRPIPATASIDIVLKGPLPSGIEVGDEVYFPKFTTTFTYDGLPYLLLKTYKYVFVQSDITNGVGISTFEKVIQVAVDDQVELVLNSDGNVPLSATVPIEVSQGELIVQEFQGNAVDQVNQTFQQYFITDSRFSNLFGPDDPFYDSEEGELDVLEALTKVGIGTDQSTALNNIDNLYDINRKSLLTAPEVLAATQTSDVPNVALIQTVPSQGIEVIFGDGIIAEKGIKTNADNLYVQYLATDGTRANKVGAISDTLQMGSSFTISGKPSVILTNNIEFRFNSNITGGSDIESVDSIRYNAPKIFQTLDRLISRSDYSIYLKSLSSPIDVQNAIAWGEQEEIEALQARGLSSTAIKKLFNIVLFSVVGPLYTLPTGGQYAPKTFTAGTADANLITGILEGSEYTSGYGENTFFNLYVKDTGGIVPVLNEQEGLNANTNVKKIQSYLRSRSQVTIRNIYVSPILQRFNIVGNVYINNLSDINTLKLNINNQIYSFLNINADFNTPIYLSNIVEIIESNREVVNVDIYFEPKAAENFVAVGSLTTDPDINITGYTASQITAIVTGIQSSINTYTEFVDADLGLLPLATSDAYYSRFDISTFRSISEPNPPFIGDGSGDWTTFQTGSIRMGNLTERSYYQDFVGDMYANTLNPANNPDALDYRNSDEFQSFVLRLNKTMKQTLENSLLDSSGNIVNYTMINEIAQLFSTITYRYRA